MLWNFANWSKCRPVWLRHVRCFHFLFNCFGTRFAIWHYIKKKFLFEDLWHSYRYLGMNLSYVINRCKQKFIQKKVLHTWSETEAGFRDFNGDGKRFHVTISDILCIMDVHITWYKPLSSLHESSKGRSGCPKTLFCDVSFGNTGAKMAWNQ